MSLAIGAGRSPERGRGRQGLGEKASSGGGHPRVGGPYFSRAVLVEAMVAEGGCPHFCGIGLYDPGCGGSTIESEGRLGVWLQLG